MSCENSDTAQNDLRIKHYLKKVLEDISIFVGPLIPLFWTSGDIYLGLKVRVDSIACMLWHLLRFTSGATSADLFAASNFAWPF